jgi:hypothetical protein
MLTEVDVYMENLHYVMVAEVKNTLQREDIKNHVRRLQCMRTYADGRGDDRKYMGAVVSPEVDLQTAAVAHKAGFFVIKMSSNAVNIVSPPEWFKPREW